MYLRSLARGSCLLCQRSCGGSCGGVRACAAPLWLFTCPVGVVEVGASGMRQRELDLSIRAFQQAGLPGIPPAAPPAASPAPPPAPAAAGKRKYTPRMTQTASLQQAAGSAGGPAPAVRTRGCAAAAAQQEEPLEAGAGASPVREPAPHVGCDTPVPSPAKQKRRTGALPLPG